MQGGEFIFAGYDAQIEQGYVNFFYTIKRGWEGFKFTEKITFDPVSGFDPDVIKKILDSLHLALGVSYWKLFCPKEILTPKISLSQNQANFWNTVYAKGLGEFFYKNKINYRRLINFPYQDNLDAPISLPRENRSLLGVGGGKDSAVAGELLKSNGREFSGFVLNPTQVHRQIAQIMGIENINIRRELDPQIFALHKREDVYNGHIPISSIYAFTGLLAAALFDYKYIIMPNEKSANYGNVEYLGEEINHQWSKSEEFEAFVRHYISGFITPDIIYFSLLRPYHEIKIAEVFARFNKYFHVFTSCNKNFRFKDPSNILWCGECPKCAFVFCLLSAFIDKDKLISIFGKNLYESESLIPTYEELLGVRDVKPFDCVGTPEEVKLALLLAYKKGSYNETPVFKMFYEKFNQEFQVIEKSSEQLLGPSSEDKIPDEFKSIIP